MDGMFNYKNVYRGNKKYLFSHDRNFHLNFSENISWEIVLGEKSKSFVILGEMSLLF